MNRSITEPGSFLMRGYILSVGIHLLIIIFAAAVLKLNFEKPVINSVYLHINNSIESRVPVKDKIYKKEEIIKKSSRTLQPEKKIENKYLPENQILINNADTSNLEQIYSESSLDVSIKYPNGWTYIDQNVKDKLDGVTFWLAGQNGPATPYVHLEVRDKNIFNPGRYKYHQTLHNFILYYNHPEELENQVSQEIYIRTETDNDFSIKLIINGKDNFQFFQPQFFGMIKSFKFGNSLF